MKARTGWTRGGTKGKCGAVYTHDATGWTVRHCGHPTANWPYYGVPPIAGQPARRGAMLLTGGIGRGIGFRTALGAQAAVEEIVRAGHVHEQRCWDDRFPDFPQLRCGHPCYLDLEPVRTP